MVQSMLSTKSSSPEMMARATEVESKLLQSSMIGSMQENEKSLSKRKRSYSHGARNSGQVNHEQRIRITARLLDVCIPSLLQSNRMSKRERMAVKVTLGDHDHVSEKENDALLDNFNSDLCVNPLNKDVKAFNEATSFDYGQVTAIPVPSTKDTNKSSRVHSISVLLVPSSPCQSQFTRARHGRARRLPTYTTRQGCVVDEHPLRTSHTSSIGSNINTISDNSRIFDNASSSKIPRVRSRRRSYSSFLSSLRSIKLIANSLLSSVKILHKLRNNPTVSRVSTTANVTHMEDDVSVPLANIPTTELRRYLNPDVNTFLIRQNSRSIPKTRRRQSCLVSIQMQTYRISTSYKYPKCSVISLRSQPSRDEERTNKIYEPNFRQRDIRENSDFMRVAVMEMLMRKRGKLNNQRPGKAKWALPPRAISTRPYKITPDGVPLRWMSITV